MTKDEYITKMIVAFTAPTWGPRMDSYLRREIGDNDCNIVALLDQQSVDKLRFLWNRFRFNRHYARAIKEAERKE